MDQENIAMGLQEVVPILFIPKQCTKLEMNCEMSENVFIDLSITSPDTEGNETCIYSGFCNVKLVESCNIHIYPSETHDDDQENSSNASIDCEDISQMPVILSDASTVPAQPYNQSQVWIDPSRSPYVYNNYDTSAQQTYSVLESSGCITVQQHNTFITQNVINYDHQSQNNHLEQDKLKKIQDIQTQQGSPNIFYEEAESESEMLLSQLSLKNKKTSQGIEKNSFASTERDNDALKQLMSTDIQSTSKQRKTILFLGDDSTSGQTIQNILYTDPMVKCSAIEVDHEVVIDDGESPTPYKKKYQCDKCKQIFDQISEFRKHMVGNHTNYKFLKTKTLSCSACGRKFSNKHKYQIHCLGHGDPDLECPRCHKVYASKINLKIHMKIHSRKFPCSYCCRSYSTIGSYKTHMKVHSKYMCQHDGFFFMTNSASMRDDPHDDDMVDYAINGDRNNNDYAIEHGHVDNNHDKDDRDNQSDNDHNGRADSDAINAQLKISKDSSDTEIGDSFLDISENFEQDLITAECDLKTEMSGEMEGDANGQMGKNEDVEMAGHENREIDKNKNGTREKNENRQIQTAKNEMEINDKNTVAETKETNKIMDVDDQDERVKRADYVIAKVMSNKIFLANSKTAKKHARANRTCQVCSKSFDRIGDLKRHLIEHIVKSTLAKAVSSKHGTLNITCEICQMESFDTIDKYKAHLREHAKLTIYKCTFCDKTFSDSSNFSKHKKIHGISYFQCDLCHRKFNSKIMIARHIELHNKNKPLQCKACNRIFHFESMLKRHIKSVHNKPPTSKFACRFCDEGFKTLKHKWDHEWVVHNIRKMIVDCLVCGAKFRKYLELKRHCLDQHEMDIPTRKHMKNKHMSNFVCQRFQF